MNEAPAPRGRFRSWYDNFFVAPLREANEEARTYLNSDEGKRFDVRTVAVLVTTAIVLTLQHYFLLYEHFYYTMGLLTDIGLGDLADWWSEALGSPAENQFRWLLYWGLGNFLLYFVPPTIVILVVFRQNLADFGFKLRGAFKDGWIYPVMFAIVAPLVWIVSKNAHFQRTYPFFDMSPGEDLWPDFWIWEVCYALQFLGLEFFFRGFMVHGLRHRFGAYAIVVMTVPYCMIHFAKPLPETFGAIIAGLVLGFMSLRTRSVLLGAAIHVSVALSMDFTSLWRQGFFGPKP